MTFPAEPAPDAAGASVRVNGHPVIGGNLWLVRDSMWSAEASVATESLAQGPATLEVYGSTYQGYIVRPGDFAARAPVFIAGCAGGLLGLIRPKSYARGIRLRDVLEDLLNAIGEKLSDKSDPAVLGAQLAAWTRRGGSAERALTNLIHAVPGAVWRTDEEGKIVVIKDKWKPGPPVGENTFLVDADPTIDCELWAIDSPAAILPGTKHAGRNVSEVHYIFGNGGPAQEGLLADRGDDAFRALVLYQDVEEVDSRFRGMFYELAREALGDTCYLRRYAATIQSVSDDERTAIVHFDDPEWEDQQVKILAPSPGAKVTPRKGDVGQVTFQNGEPSAIIIDGWESAGRNARPVVRKGDKVDCGYQVVTTAEVGMGGAPVVVSVVWLKPGTTPVPPSTKLITVTHMIGETIEGSEIIGVE